MPRDPRHNGQTPLANLPQREIVSFPKKRALQRETRWGGERKKNMGAVEKGNLGISKEAGRARGSV